MLYVPMFRLLCFFVPFVIEIKMIACPQISVCVCLFFCTNFYILISFDCVLFARSFQFILFYIYFFLLVYNCYLLKRRNAQLFVKFPFEIYNSAQKFRAQRIILSEISFYFNSQNQHRAKDKASTKLEKKQKKQKNGSGKKSERVIEQRVSVCVCKKAMEGKMKGKNV